MQEYKTVNPVVIIIFNRYDCAKKVMAQIKKVKPKDLFVIADGARVNRPQEKELCNKARSIVDEVDWDCNVHKIFSDVNLGCAKRVTSGLNEVFSVVDTALIFEDDCIPSLSFFRFADEMLERYKNEERVMLVSATNKCFDPKSKKEIPCVNESYFFSHQVQIWGWATWKRAWNFMDLEMTDWPRLKKEGIVKRYYKKASYIYHWNSSFDYVYKGRTISWAFPWQLSVWKQDALSIIPKVNMVENAGFGEDATHTSSNSIFASRKAEELSFPLIHPTEIKANNKMDMLEMKSRIADSKQLPFPLNMFASKLKWFLLKLIKCAPKRNLHKGF